jgi:hypothetical protein
VNREEEGLLKETDGLGQMAEDGWAWELGDRLCVTAVNAHGLPFMPYPALFCGLLPSPLLVTTLRATALQGKLLWVPAWEGELPAGC